MRRSITCLKPRAGELLLAVFLRFYGIRTLESVSVQASQFGFAIVGTTSIPIVVEASASLANAVWMPLQTCTLTNGVIYFSDPAWTNYPSRFYRIRSP